METTFNSYIKNWFFYVRGANQSIETILMKVLRGFLLCEGGGTAIIINIVKSIH